MSAAADRTLRPGAGTLAVANMHGYLSDGNDDDALAPSAFPTAILFSIFSSVFKELNKLVQGYLASVTTSFV